MNTEDSEFERIEREQAMRNVPDAIHHTDTSEPLMYIQGWNDCRQAMLVEQPAQQKPWLVFLRNNPKASCETVGAWLRGHAEYVTGERFYFPQQPAQQEPAGCLKSDPDEGHVFVPRIEGDWSMLGKDLYTTPQAQPAREWVGLTRKEVHDLYDSDYEVFHRRIEAKLKEKNT